MKSLWKRRRFIRHIKNIFIFDHKTFIGLSHRRIKNMATWNKVSIALLGFIIIILLTGGFLFLWYAKDLPRPGNVSRKEGFSTVITDSYGEKLYDVFEEENRIPLKNLSDAPKSLRDATIAVEDKDFYKHGGVSSSGIIRSLFNILFFHRLEGGSTLTQQLVKNVLLTQERTLPRKIKEAILAVQIERKYSKDEILQMYLSETPYGGPTVGVVAASDYYFQKPINELTLAESAFLAGLSQSPSLYSPYLSDSKSYIWRTEQVLRRMREDGYIKNKEEKDANDEIKSISFKTTARSSLRAPHFVAYIKELITSQFGDDILKKGGYTVTTTLDWKLQEKTQLIIQEEIDKVKYLKVGNGAAVVLDPKNGNILAMVGSKDFLATESGGYQFNVATQGQRQPGSAIKPFTYATAFLRGYTPSTLLLDVETKYPSASETDKDKLYNPKNYDGKYRGPIQLRYALGNSINTIAVKVNALVGVKDVLNTAYDMGLNTLEPTDENLKRIGLSLTLGGGEVTLLDLTSGYAVFAANGQKQDPVAILKIEDIKGKKIFEHKPSKPKQVIKSEVAYLISNILSDNDARKDVFGLQSLLVISGKTVAVKTGTTDDKRDNWTIGYTPSIAAGVWVGNNDNSPMNSALASGLTGAAPIWNRIIKEALKDKPDEPFTKPDNVIDIEIDSYGGGLPVSDKPSRHEIFIKGTEPTGPAAIYQKLKVSKHDNSKLANTIEVAKGEYEEKTFIVFKEDDPVSTDGKNRWQEGIDVWINLQNDEKLKYPKDVYQGTDEKIVVRFKKPTNGQRIDNNSVEIKVEANGVEEIKEIKLYVNDQEKTTVNSKSFETTLNLSNGSYLLKVRVKDVKDNTAEDTIRIGVNQDYSPSPTIEPTKTPTNTPIPSPT